MNTRANIIWRSDFVKDLLTNFYITNFSTLCGRKYFAVVPLTNIHCQRNIDRSWELSLIYTTNYTNIDIQKSAHKNQFYCWFSSAPVFQWCCSTPQGSPGVGRNTFLSSPHLCFIKVFICDLFVSRDDPLMS